MAYLDRVTSWGRCKFCLQIIWTEISRDSQSCGCRCGHLVIKDSKITVSEGLDSRFDSVDMEATLVKEYKERG